MNSFQHKIVSSILTLVFTCLSVAVSAQTTSVDDGYVRESIPGNHVTSAYMTINNLADSPVRLIGANSSISDRIEIHAHIMADGMMQMRQVDGLEIGSKSSVILQPMGYHLMMFDLKNPLNDGEQIDMTLEFSDQSTLIITLPIQSIKKPAHHH